MMKVNLGGVGLKDFVNVDISWLADKRRNLNWQRIPFKNNSVDVLISISFINYFTRERAAFLIKDVHRVLKPDGLCRFGIQDMEIIFKKYLMHDPQFTCERINRWFNSSDTDGCESCHKRTKYVYDYETLRGMFLKAGFSYVSDKLKFGEGKITGFDNRPEQQFFLEASK